MSYEEQIISADKYPSICLRQMESIVFIIVQIIFATRTVLKFPSFSWGDIPSRDAFRPIAREQKYLMDHKTIEQK